MDAVIVAGGTPSPKNPLYAELNGQPKALLEIGGQTMLMRVAAALIDCPTIDDVLIIGLPHLRMTGLDPSTPHRPDAGGLVENIGAGFEWLLEKNGPCHALFISVDIPSITPQAISRFIARCQPLGMVAYYPFISRECIESQFPLAQRTYSRMPDGEITGGNLMVAHTDMFDTDPHLWRQFVGARKSPLALARLVGLKPLLKLALRRLSPEDAAALATRIFGKPFASIVINEPSLGMDVDKPEDLAILRSFFRAP